MAKLVIHLKPNATGRYNWTDINPMLWSINAAKSSFRFAFESDADLQMWFDEHHEEYDDLVNHACTADRNIEEIESALEEMRQTWVEDRLIRKFAKKTSSECSRRFKVCFKIIK